MRQYPPNGFNLQLAPGVRQLRYRPEIDGLRALAVGGVIINHLRSDWLPSGHLGVDIFFVISGFVITQSLCAQRHSSFADMYLSFIARRVRRLAPALLTCVIVSAFAVWLVVPSPQDSLRTGIFGMFGLSNLYLYFQHVDYFTPGRELNVFLHTWSLGVEEQFYLFFPGILWMCCAKKWRASRLTVVVGALSVASLIACFAFAGVDPQATFYLMPFRFWELGAGVVLFALGSDTHVGMPRWIGACIAIITSILLVASLFGQPDKNGVVQFGVVILTMVAILAIRCSAITLAVFSNRPIVFVGLISYPLYLWHWPIISLSRWTDLDAVRVVPLQLALTFLLSFLTYRLVEKPVRHAAALQPNWRAITAVAIALACCTAAVAQFRQVKSIFGLSSARETLLAGAPPAFVPLPGSGLDFIATCVVNGDSVSLLENTFKLCTVSPREKDGATIWTMGDSHAGHLQALLSALHTRLGVGVHLIETSGIPFPMQPGKTFEPRLRLYAMLSKKLRSGDIVLLGRLFLDRTRDGMLEDVPAWTNQLVEFARELATRNIKVVVMGPPPMFHFNTLLSCLRPVGSGCDIERTMAAKQAERVQRILQSAAQQTDNIFVFDPFDAVCPVGTAACSPLKEGKAIFRDKDHFNSYGAELLTDSFVTFLKTNELSPHAE